jgi:hypothetical protein
MLRKAMLQHDATSNFSRCAAAVLSSEVFEHVVGLTCHRISYVIGFPMSSDLLCHRSVS